MKLKLVCFDMDGVIFKDINFWMTLHKKFETEEAGEKLTRRFLHSNYEKLVNEVVSKLWKGLNARPYYELIDSMEYNQGVQKVFEYLRKRGIVTVIISASSIDAAKRVQRECGVNFIFGNELVVKNGRVSGEFLWPVGAGKENKAVILKKLCHNLNIKLSDVAYVGDSETDVEAMKIVGLPIAFNTTSSAVKMHAKEVVRGNNLLDVLKILMKNE